MRSHRPEKEDPSDTSEGKEDASGETQVPKSKLENGSDSDSDLGGPSDYKLQPVSRKRTNQETQSPAVKSAAKKSKTAAGSSSLGGSSTRLWSDEDEVTLLKGIIKYNKSTGHSFNADLLAFYRFMEGKLGIDVTKDQLTAKPRKLKAKFLDALKKRGNGKDPEFSKPHEVKMFKLSKKIWGGSVNVMDGENSSVPKNGKSLKKGENSKKRHVVEVELDEKEKDIKKKKDSGKIVEVVLDEKKDGGKIVEVVLDEMQKDSGKIVEVVLDEKKKNSGKIVKKCENSKKRHAVEVELDEKEKDDGISVKKKKDSGRIVEVVLDEKKDSGKIVEVVLDEMKKDSGKIVEVVLDEKKKDSGKKIKKGENSKKRHAVEVELDEKEKDDGKSVKKKGENSKKRHAVEVELDEKEKDNGRSLKKKKDSGKIVEVILDEKKDSGKIVEVVLDEKKKDSGKIVVVVLDEKKDSGKIVKKDENSKKRNAVEVELDEKEKDNGRSVKKKKGSGKIMEVVLDEKKKDSGKIVEIVLDEKKDTGKIVKKGENSKKRHAVEVELDEKEKDNGVKTKKDSGKIVEVVLDKKMKDSGKIVKKGKTVKKHVREVELDEKEKDEGEDDAKEEEMAEGVDFQSKYLFLSCSIGNLMSSVPSTVLPESGVSSALKRIGSIGDGKAKELDDKCKRLIMEEAELSFKKLALIKEQMGMSFDN